MHSFRTPLFAAVFTIAAATLPAQFFTDFENGADGFSATGDWQLGSPIGVVGSQLPNGFGGPEPVGGFSGQNCFGTVIGGLHSPSTVSTLSRTFDFSSSHGTTLHYREWLESGGNSFDRAQVIVNGNVEYLGDGDSNSAFRLVSLDLSAYDGLASVVVEFVFSTTGVVERVGWYVDDVGINVANGPFGAGCSDGQIPDIAFSRNGSLGVIDLSSTLANRPAALMLGFDNLTWGGQPLPFALTAFGRPDCFILVNPLANLLVWTDASGNASYSFQAGPLSGVTLFCQWIVADPGAAHELHVTSGLAVSL
ncbi:MAG: hypothetical protein KDE27_14110 [Planctomycetes bacterium]|nr:hypothetical protein [Planctomycetota bacterium]